jgi:hypothetical protein
MYIYDRPSQGYHHPNFVGGLGALHGSIGGKRSEVMPPAEQAAEVTRLTEEITKLAGRNAWTGVDDLYKKLERMGDVAFNLIPKGVTAAAAIHELGAQASDTLGDMRLKQTRLLRAKRSVETTGPIDDVALRRIIESLDTLEKAYGAVAIAPRSVPLSKRDRKRLQGQGPKLTRVAQPGEQLFMPGLLKSIEFAAKAIRDTGSFDGLLPAGSYTVAGQSFTVNAGTELTGKRRTNVLWDN